MVALAELAREDVRVRQRRAEVHGRWRQRIIVRELQNEVEGLSAEGRLGCAHVGMPEKQVVVLHSARANVEARATTNRPGATTNKLHADATEKSARTSGSAATSDTGYSVSSFRSEARRFIARLAAKEPAVPAPTLLEATFPFTGMCFHSSVDVIVLRAAVPSGRGGRRRSQSTGNVIFQKGCFRRVQHDGATCGCDRAHQCKSALPPHGGLNIVCK